ncbi:GTPase domain-containing protein (plasmid) [Rhodovastum atsumiense]|uniref:GTPase domain-containing protein n=1 Tax=Rhodovastum atsumiense TaxID=504468 RepID=A0A5M6IJV6_9PROT|nr:GTPase domain-containing protein [Rhodovastum atsumiense]KAA5607965.1 GTPase domain-containing protein [Rhodovastum atsumiense]CAH2606004.1 GTPase domain-containing protein [Rhodovastum atsumiense]
METALIQESLAAAAQAAVDALDRTVPDRDTVLEALNALARRLARGQVIAVPDNNEQAQQLTSALMSHREAASRSLEDLIATTADRLGRSFSYLRDDARYVTVLLFGRTRVGKSTLMEALVHGDGRAIGKGRQHTTTEVTSYYFPAGNGDGPPAVPTLRVIDTPGIEGYEGDALAAMAEAHVERADHIFFVLTDDKATADELSRFGLIRTQGKGITVILNVKTNDEDLDLLEQSPASVFRSQEIDGHSRRIAGYLQRHFSMPPPRILPVHARAGWMGRCAAGPEGDPERRLRLERGSRLREVEGRLASFIAGEALPARLRAPRDLLLSHVWTLREELLPFATAFQQLADQCRDLEAAIRAGARRAEAKAKRRFPALRGRFQAASDGIPGVVDEVISTAGRGTDLQRRWQRLLEENEVTNAGSWFLSEAAKDFSSELAEDMRAAAFEHSAAGAEDLGGLLDAYHDATAASQRNKYVRAGARAVAGSGAGALAIWGIANFWNPTGWVALAAAAVATATVATAAEEITRKGTDVWESSTKRGLFEKKSEIVAQLRQRVWRDHQAVEKECERWLAGTRSGCEQMTISATTPVRRSAAALAEAVLNCLSELDAATDRTTSSVAEDVFRTCVPACADGRVRVLRAVLSPGYRAKVLLERQCEDEADALELCFGPGGTPAAVIAGALGVVAVDAVDVEGTTKDRIQSALGVPGCRAQLRRDGGVSATPPQGMDVAALAGPDGRNLQLAERLLDMRIMLEEVA